jgi:DNA-binding MarR family transcriptional regulator
MAMDNEYRSVPLVKQLCDALEREVNNAVRSQGLTYSQIQLLLRLSEVDNRTLHLKELEARLNVSQATVAGLVKRLAKKGFVECLDDALDKRVKRARLSAKGAFKCEEAHAHMDAIEAKLSSGLSDIETKLFYALLQKANDKLR